jgi:hypothetical protein
MDILPPKLGAARRRSRRTDVLCNVVKSICVASGCSLACVRSIARVLAAAGCAAGIAFAALASPGATGASPAMGFHGRYISRAEPGSEVRLVAILAGGMAGWCVDTKTHDGNGCGSPRASNGPIYAEGCQVSPTVTSISVLTTSAVAAVSVAGGLPIKTRTYPTLLDGLRAVVVELRGHAGQPQPGVSLPCPKATPLDARLRPLSRHGKPNKPLAIVLPGRTWWLGKLDSGRRTCPISPPAPTSCVPASHPPSGACHLTATNPGPGITEQGGSIATRIQPAVGLVGTTYLSCVDYEYFYEEEDRLDSAVLLNAQHPGAEPPPLPAMNPLAGHPGIFTSPGVEGERIARRIPSAWLVVEESDQIGLKIPLALLETLSAEINL